MLNILNQRTRFITIVLEDIYDPHNGSACLRSCEANGIQDIYIIENQNTFSTKEGVSMGSAKWLNLYYYKSRDFENPSLKCFEALRSKGYQIVGMSSSFDSPKKFLSLNEYKINTPTAFVFGSEKNGLSTFAKEYLDEFLTIPMYGFVESYNISVACAILVYTMIQQIKKSSLNWQLQPEEKDEILFRWLKKEIHYWEEIVKIFNDKNKN